MAVYHKVHKNTGLNAFGQTFVLDSEGQLSPDPDKETTELFRRLPNYYIDTPVPAAVDEAPLTIEKPETEAPKKKKTIRKKTGK